MLNCYHVGFESTKLSPRPQSDGKLATVWPSSPLHSIQLLFLKKIKACTTIRTIDMKLSKGQGRFYLDAAATQPFIF